MPPGQYKELTDKINELNARLKEIEKRLRINNDELDKTPKAADKVKGSFDRLGQTIKTAFTITGILAVIDKVVEIGQKIIEVTGIGERYQNQFTRIFEGNATAEKGYLSTLQTTADTTNFTFDELADNVAKLASRGIVPTQQELLKLGDTANFINKPFEQLNEAILDGSNPERWKELGFVVTTQGDKMTLSYGDFSKTVDKTTKGAYQAIQAFAQQGKVLGSTAEAGQTLIGRISTLADNFAGFFRVIGNGNKGTLNDLIDFISRIVKGGTELVQTLQPAFDTLTKVFGLVFKTIGGLVTSFSTLNNSGAQVGTTAQKIGFFFNKYVIDPFILVIGVATQVVEGFNTIVISGELAAAKLTGNKGLVVTLTKQLDDSIKRTKDLRTEFGKTFTDMGQNLDTYVAKDNQRKRREDRRARLAQDEAESFKFTSTDNNSGANAKTDPKVTKAQQEEYNLLLDAKKKYQEELAKLEEQYGKEQLEALDKNSEAYVKQKAEIDRQALNAERDQLEAIFRVSQSKTTVVNKQTGKREAVIDSSLKLPEKTQQIYDNRSAAITAEENRKLEELRYQNNLKLLQINRQFDELEVTEVRHKWEEIIKTELAGFTGTADQRTKKEAELRAKQKADEERVKIGQAITQVRNQEEISLAFVDTKRFEDELKAEKGNALGIVNIEAEKEKKRLQIRIDSGEKLIAYLKAQGAKENAVLITQTQAAVDALKKQQGDFTSLDTSSGAGFFGSLLGLGGDELDKFKKAIGSIGDSINTVAQIQIQASEERINALQTEIDAKQQQVSEEEARNKEGTANNLSLRKAELDDLKRRKAEEEAVQRKAVKTQQELDLVSSTSNNIATTSYLLKSAAKAIDEAVGIPIVGIFLAIAAVASIYATFAAFQAKAKSLTQLRDGGRIPTDGRTHEGGGHRIEDTDVEVERGEWVVNAKSSAKYDTMLDAINKDNPHRALQALVEQHGLGLPNVVVSQLHQPAFSLTLPPIDMSALTGKVDETNRRIDLLIDHVAAIPKSQMVGIGDGRVIEKEGNRTTITDHKKR